MKEDTEGRTTHILQDHGINREMKSLGSSKSLKLGPHCQASSCSTHTPYHKSFAGFRLSGVDNVPADLSGRNVGDLSTR